MRYVKEKERKVYLNPSSLSNGYLKMKGCVNYFFLNQVLSNKNLTVCMHLLSISFLLFILLGLFAFLLCKAFHTNAKGHGKNYQVCIQSTFLFIFCNG